MCGRYAIVLTQEELVSSLREVQQHVDEIVGTEHARTSTNVAPKSYAPVYRKAENGKRALEYMKWSLQPSTATEMVNYSTFNCRSDSLQRHHPAWKCGHQNRAIALMNGYYEWEPNAGKGSAPFYIQHTSSKLLYALAIWDQNIKILPNGQELRTYAIVTTQAMDPKMQSIHPRMPIFIDPQHIDLWLEGPFNATWGLLRAYPKLQYYRVGPEVNNIKNQGKSLIKPLRNYFTPARRVTVSEETTPGNDSLIKVSEDTPPSLDTQTGEEHVIAPPKKPRTS